MKIHTIRPVYVESFPKTLEEGVIYISRPFNTACHLCCCGCGTKIVTPLRPTEYRLTEIGGLVSMYPSIGNWNHPCQSHYVFRKGRVIQAMTMSRSEIDIGREYDDAEKRAYFHHNSRHWLGNIFSWIRNLFR